MCEKISFNKLDYKASGEVCGWEGERRETAVIDESEFQSMTESSSLYSVQHAARCDAIKFEGDWPSHKEFEIFAGQIFVIFPSKVFVTMED